MLESTWEEGIGVVHIKEQEISFAETCTFLRQPELSPREWRAKSEGSAEVGGAVSDHEGCLLLAAWHRQVGEGGLGDRTPAVDQVCDRSPAVDQVWVAPQPGVHAVKRMWI